MLDGTAALARAMLGMGRSSWLMSSSVRVATSALGIPGRSRCMTAKVWWVAKLAERSKSLVTSGVVARLVGQFLLGQQCRCALISRGDACARCVRWAYTPAGVAWPGPEEPYSQGPGAARRAHERGRELGTCQVPSRVKLRQLLANTSAIGMRVVSTSSFRFASGTQGPAASGKCWSVMAALVSVSCLCASSVAFGQENTTERSIEPSTISSHAPDTLRQFNASLVALTNRVSRAVVQIMVTGYGPAVEEPDRSNVSHQRKIGSGVIVDSDGYILTNAHVIEGAQRIRVALSQPPGTSPLQMSAIGRTEILDATLIGLHRESDIALLKVKTHKLPALPLAATRPVYPGEVVLAIGSPDGLQGSVSMGIVSSVWRQPNPDVPMVYIQTDAPINPGNSGGPLIDLDGNVIGLNTFILSKGGGSEGVAFAIPARIVRFVYDNLRKYGLVQRAEIGASAQEITPTLAAGLGLPRNWGVLIADLAPAGPAAAAGLKLQDIIDAVDGHQVVGLPGFAAALYLHPADEDLKLEVLRGQEKIAVVLPAMQRAERYDLADLIDPRNVIEGLGVFVVAVDDRFRSPLSTPRNSSGVLVIAKSPGLNVYTSDLRPGDIVYQVNRQGVESVQQVRSLLRHMSPGQPVALQVERGGQLQYIAFEWGE
jgi:serine protease Do